jgi:DNA-binding NarL/FixJ family response regulator
MKPLRILIADDHEMVRQGLVRVIAEQSHWLVVGEASNGRQAVAKARSLKPDIVIMDFTMPELNGLEATRQICAALPDCEVLVLTMHASEEILREVMEAGARGYVLKSDAGRALVDAVRTVSEHKPYFQTKLSTAAASSVRKPGVPEIPRLTPREREIVQLVAEGRSTKEVADVLGISIKTCETHRTNILRKLQLRSVSELVRYAIRNKIVEA